MPLINAWWTVWLIDGILTVAARVSRNATTFSGLRIADVIDIANSVANIGAATLFILVVRRITQAQGRWPAKTQAVGEATGQPAG